MSKKMKIIPSIFKNKQAKHPWQWPSCKHAKASFFNVGPQESSSSNSDEKEEDAPAAVISGGRLSERLFFEPEETSSIMRESRNGKNSSKRWMFKDSVAMALESEDPYLDFKRSMEEMVESKNLFKDWDCLEELLVWYLRMNGKINHGFIVGAFVDLLLGFSAAAAAADSKKKKKTAVVSASDSMSTTTYYSSASSSFSSAPSPLSPHHS